MSTPALSTRVAASFFIGLRVDCHSIGMGIRKRKISVDTFPTNMTQTIGFETAAWHIFPGSGLICQYAWNGRHDRNIVMIRAMKVIPMNPIAMKMRIRNRSRPF
jgi:hypothetical protein